MYIFIINPTAGSGRAEQIFSNIQQSESYQNIQSEAYVTNSNGHAEKLVRKLTSTSNGRIRALIVIGGDGTLHEVMNGIGDYQIPVAVIPSGSGNDFARATFIPNDPVSILNLIVEGKSDMPYWLGNYQVDDEAKRHFVNSIGFGFDAHIVRTANRSFYKKTLNKLRLGKLSYMIALIQVLFRYQPMNVQIKTSGEKRTLTDCWMVTIANHPYYGGGMKIIPNASIQPAVFPVLIIHSISRWKILGLFMTVFTGKHTLFKEVELLETTTLHISSAEEIYYQVDGESYVGKNHCVITKQSEPMHIIGTTTQMTDNVAL